MQQWPPVYDAGYHPESRTRNAGFRKLKPWTPRKGSKPLFCPSFSNNLNTPMRIPGLYRKKWDAVGVNPEDIQSLDDFEAIPILTKDELRADQAAHPPFGSNLCVSHKELARVHGTSGTTGRPTAFGISKGDIQRIAETHARVMWAHGHPPGRYCVYRIVFQPLLGQLGSDAGRRAAGGHRLSFWRRCPRPDRPGD